MCHCGDYYCDMSDEARKWANEEHDRLSESSDWKEKYPDLILREHALVQHIRTEVHSKFGNNALDFRWDE